MSLVGNLQDLGLGEILQIVSLSRKSGTLALRSEGRTGTIVFRQGQVVRASSSNYKLNLGTILLQKALVNPDTLDKALAIQQEEGFSERLGAILINRFDVSKSTIEEVVCEQIESIVFSMFEWNHGTFDFVVLDYVETLDGIRMDPLQFMLDQGLNPQFLALEGSRILDEKNIGVKVSISDEMSDIDSTDVTPPVRSQTSPTPKTTVEHIIVVVDDDGPTLKVVSDRLQEMGCKVHATTRSEDAIVIIDSLVRAGKFPLLLVDLIMPKMDGSGVLGGVELIALLHNNFKNLPIVVMTDYHFEDAEKQILDFGYQFIFKPRRVEINDQTKVQIFMTQLVSEIERFVPFASLSVLPSESTSMDELKSEDELLSVENIIEKNLASEPDTEQDLSRINELLDDFYKSDPQGGILLLALRFATEFLSRSIVFMVHNNVVSGVGQFGISGGKYRGDEIVRSIRIPLESASLFLGPCKSGRSSIVNLDPSATDRLFFDQIGGGIPDEVFIGPIVSKSRVIGFLYGDNLPDKKPIGNIEILDTFLSHVGMTMEKNLLERLLNENSPK
jgi:CheY-like chemotaxis protein